MRKGFVTPMKSDAVAVRIRNLTKEYRLYNKPIQRVVETFLPSERTYHQAFRALDNVSLEIHKGETVGIVGRNGSGKSTLLQIICGIVKPTVGAVDVQGRISALLELGAGFNPEFTGRQNVHLNGSILGLTQVEIEERLDDILSFADIGEFIDQPVKSYSSGMFVRLAFSVAISVEPEILVVDEALSVGDEAFQRKCFAKINSIQERGGTILFVSHSTTSIVELCSRAFMLDKGELLIAGEPKQVVSRYQKMIYAPEETVGELKQQMRMMDNRFDLQLEEVETIENNQGEKKRHREGAGKHTQETSEYYDPHLVPASIVEYERKGAAIFNPRLEDEDGTLVNILKNGKTYYYAYQVKFDRSITKVKFGMLIKTIKGVEICGCSADSSVRECEAMQKGQVVLVRFPFQCLFYPDVYFLNAGVLGVEDEGEFYMDRRIDVAMFRVIGDDVQHCTALTTLVGFPDITTEHH